MSITKSKTKKISRSTESEYLKYTPIIVKLPNIEKSIFEEESDVYFSSNIDYPRSEYGFHHFIHQTKNTTQILKKFDGKKKVYLVFNRFERYIDNYDDSIGNISKNFFGLEKDTPDILSRGFYKLWEILLLFDLIDIKQDNFVSAHLAEGPGSFIQATIFYRDMYCKKGLSKNDKYHAITLHPNDKKEYIPELETHFVKYYEKEKPKRFIQHKTVTTQEASSSTTKDDGDLTNPKTIKLFSGDMKEKADLVTADGGFEWVNENIQEQEAFKLIIGEVITAIKIQKKGGNFVCKFFEMFTRTSIKIITILRELYNNVYLVKPLTSRSSNSEKYAVCTGFKYDEKHKEYKNISKKLDDLLEKLYKNKEDKVADIFTNYTLDKNLINAVINANISIANNQFENINKMIDFVKKEIYSGDVYHDKKDEQIEGAKYWNDMFLQEITKQSEARKIYNNIIDHVVTNSNKEIEELSSKLVTVESQL